MIDENSVSNYISFSDRDVQITNNNHSRASKLKEEFIVLVSIVNTTIEITIKSDSAIIAAENVDTILELYIGKLESVSASEKIDFTRLDIEDLNWEITSISLKSDSNRILEHRCCRNCQHLRQIAENRTNFECYMGGLTYIYNPDVILSKLHCNAFVLKKNFVK